MADLFVLLRQLLDHGLLFLDACLELRLLIPQTVGDPFELLHLSLGIGELLRALLLAVPPRHLQLLDLLLQPFHRRVILHPRLLLQLAVEHRHVHQGGLDLFELRLQLRLLRLLALLLLLEAEVLIPELLGFLREVGYPLLQLLLHRAQRLLAQHLLVSWVHSHALANCRLASAVDVQGRRHCVRGGDR